MGGGNWDKIHAWQNRAAGQVDRAIAREKKLKEEGRWKEPTPEKPKDPDAWDTRYPSYVAWENALAEISRYNVNGILRELRDYADMNTQPQQAYNWLKSLYNSKTEPRDAWNTIKEKLHW